MTWIKKHETLLFLIALGIFFILFWTDIIKLPHSWYERTCYDDRYGCPTNELLP